MRLIFAPLLAHTIRRWCLRDSSSAISLYLESPGRDYSVAIRRGIRFEKTCDTGVGTVLSAACADRAVPGTRRRAASGARGVPYPRRDRLPRHQSALWDPAETVEPGRSGFTDNGSVGRGGPGSEP